MTTTYKLPDTVSLTEEWFYASGVLYHRDTQNPVEINNGIYSCAGCGMEVPQHIITLFLLGKFR